MDCTLCLVKINFTDLSQIILLRRQIEVLLNLRQMIKVIVDGANFIYPFSIDIYFF